MYFCHFYVSRTYVENILWTVFNVVYTPDIQSDYISYLSTAKHFLIVLKTPSL